MFENGNSYAFMISYIFRCLKCLDMSVVKHMCCRLLCSELSFCLKYSCWVTWQRNGSKIWVTWLYFFGYTSFVEQSSLLRVLCFSVFFICNRNKIVGFVQSGWVPPPSWLSKGILVCHAIAITVGAHWIYGWM